MIILGHEPVTHLMQLRRFISPKKYLLPTRFDPEDLVVGGVPAAHCIAYMLADQPVAFMKYQPVAVGQKSKGFRTIR